MPETNTGHENTAGKATQDGTVHEKKWYEEPWKDLCDFGVELHKRLSRFGEGILGRFVLALFAIGGAILFVSYVLFPMSDGDPAWLRGIAMGLRCISFSAVIWGTVTIIRMIRDGEE
jgi:hypothetical protein